MKDIISIKSEYIKLDAALKMAGYVNTGGHAKVVIKNGEVKVNGEICTMRGKKLKDGDFAEFEGKTLIIRNAG